MAEHGEPWLPHSRAVQTPQECGGKQDSWTVYILVFCNYNCMFFSVQQNTKAKSYLSCLIHYSEKIRGRLDHHHMSVKKITLSELLMSISEHTAKIGLHQDWMWSWYSLAASMVTAQHRAAWLAFPRDQQNSYWCLFLFTEESRLSVSTRDRHERASKAVAHFTPCNDSLIPPS